MLITDARKVGKRANLALDRCLCREKNEPSSMAGVMQQPQQQMRDALPLCPRCATTRMMETVTIAPFGEKPSLIAYECPKCGHIKGVFQPTPNGHNAATGGRWLGD